MNPTPVLPRAGELAVRPWPDPVIDAAGYDPRSTYVETFWAGVLGPSTLLLLRRLAARLEEAPEGFGLDPAVWAAELGLRFPGKGSPFARAVGRLCHFGLAAAVDPATLLVRRHVPPLAHRYLRRLPTSLQEAHADWMARERAEAPQADLRRRARQLALSLVELGEDAEAIERHLYRWRFHPALCREAAVWAWATHHARLRTSGAPDDDAGDGTARAAPETGGHRPAPHLEPGLRMTAPPPTPSAEGAEEEAGPPSSGAGDRRSIPGGAPGGASAGALAGAPGPAATTRPAGLAPVPSPTVPAGG